MAVLQADLRLAGIRADFTVELASERHVPASVSAIVWFADGYPAIAVTATIARLRALRPGVRLVLVTAWPEEFAALLFHATGRITPLILRESVAAVDIIGALQPQLSPDASS